MKHILFNSIVFAFICMVVVVSTPPKIQAQNFWEVRSVDTMKYSRDISREKDILDRIPFYVEKVASLKPSHIAIATPYNEEFYPVLSTWVNEARKYNLNIWFRGNWSEWEGWFGYDRFTRFDDHHQKTYEFILKHPELFADGDIFTPVPEAENGGPGDPRGDSKKAEAFRQFLMTSYDTCEKAIKRINVQMRCGYFSVNGDIARQIFTKDMVKKTGNVVVIDHFVKTPEKLVSDIQFLHEVYDAPVVLGEFGGPIPDIHGEMTELKQAAYIQDVFTALLGLGDTVSGINYWTAFGGSTRIFEDKTYDPRRGADVVRSFFNPPMLTGIVTDTMGNRVDGATIKALDGAIEIKTDSQGKYALPLPGRLTQIIVSKEGVIRDYAFEIGLSKDVEVKNITVQSVETGLLGRIRLFVTGLITKLQSLLGQK